MLKLLIEDDEGRKTTVPLMRTEISIGRQEGNTIRLTERNVSRRHARIVRDGDRVWLEDASRYGSRKNGRRFAGRTELELGDTVLIGDYRIALADDEAVDVPEAAATTPRPEPQPADTSTVAVQRRAESIGRPMGRLVCATPPFRGSDFAVLGDIVIIGRAPECDVVIEHPSVSKQHARIVRDLEEIFIEDLGSSNGVTVNGQPRKKATLRSGDRVELGGLEFRFATPSASIPAVTDDDSDAPSRSRAPLIAGVVAVAVVGGLAWAILRPVPPAPVETVVTTVDNASRAAFDEGQSHLNAARWADAVAAFDRVATNSDQSAEAASLRERAVAEQQNQTLYDDIRRLEDEGNVEAAYRRIADVPRSSYYRSRITDENIERRLLGALIDARVVASRDAQSRGDISAARSVLEDVRGLAPDDVRISSRLAEIDAAEAGVAAPRQATAPTAPDPDRTAVRTTDPVPQRTEAPAPDAGAAEPPAVAAAQPDDTRARADELKASARRAGIQGNHQEAIRQLEEANTLNPSDAQINLMLFQNYRSVGNRNRAARALRRYLEQEPGDPRRAEYEAWLAENAPE